MNLESESEKPGFAVCFFVINLLINGFKPLLDGKREEPFHKAV